MPHPNAVCSTVSNFAQLVVASVILFAPAAGRAEGLVVLGNDAWPPFVLAGAERGTAEQLVCTALQRAGWSCEVNTDDWELVLDQARNGAIDGIAAAWRSPAREEFLLFSKPYLTNRIVPIVARESPIGIAAIGDLAGLRVALVADYAYGKEITESGVAFHAVPAADPLQAMQTVRDGRADVALVDELVARDALDESRVDGVTALNATLAMQELHFAVSKANPRGARLLDDFHRAYHSMLEDGTVNEILDIDWLASDFGHLGRTDLVLRTGVTLDQVTHPASEGAVYSLGRSRYDHSEAAEQDDSRVNYQIGGKSHSSLQQAINNVFGKEIGCEHKEFSSEFDCTNLLKK